MIKSVEENQFIYDLLRNTGGGRQGWIGLHRNADNKFYWLNSRPVEGNFENWKRGKPSKGDNEDCVLLKLKNPAGKWNGRDCSYTSPVAICQWPI